MSEVQRINITLPKRLVEKSRILIEEGLFSNFSELVREGIKDELELSKLQLDKMAVLRKWLGEEKRAWFDTSKLTEEQIMKRLRRTREQLWEEKFKLIYD